MTILSITFGLLFSATITLAVVLWRSAEAHRRTRSRLDGLHKDYGVLKDTLDAVDQLAPEFRKVFPRGYEWHSRPMVRTSTGVDWDSVRMVADELSASRSRESRANRAARLKSEFDAYRAGKGKK